MSLDVFSAEYFDGLRATGYPVDVYLRGSDLIVQRRGVSLPETWSTVTTEHPAFPIRISLSKLVIQPKLGQAKRVIDFADGARLEADVLSPALAQHAQQSNSGVFWQCLHYLENHLFWVACALLLTVAAGWGFLKFGVPVLAEQVAMRTPVETEAKLGDEVLKGMDNSHLYFSPSQQEAKHLQAIRQRLAYVCAHLSGGCPAYRLEFRFSDVIGPNAFALPGGVIVMTDALITLSKNDDELVAVLAHEMGHVQGRHAFRQTLQSTMSGLILAAVTGDVNSLASGMPAVLLQLSYTRGLENEADHYALQALKQACIPPHVFADILGRLSQTIGADHMPEIISSHPDTVARNKPFLAPWAPCATL